MMRDNVVGFKDATRDGVVNGPRGALESAPHIDSGRSPINGGLMISRRGFVVALGLMLVPVICSAEETGLRKYLYVAEPGVRDYQEFGGHGVIVFDMDNA